MISRLLSAVPQSGAGIYNGINPLTQPISLFLVQATLIIGFCQFLALASKPLKSPKVIFEIIGGILLGPSALCRNQWFANALFNPTALANLSLVASIGLTFYMFTVGLEFDTSLMLSQIHKTGVISLAGLAIPFCVGIGIAGTMQDILQPDANVNRTSFAVFIGVAMCITAFPVLARILKDTGLLFTRCGALAMGAAALDDACAWCLLALAISLAAGSAGEETGKIFATVVGFTIFVLLMLRPFMEWLVTSIEASNQRWLKDMLFPFAICMLFMCAWFTELIGLDTIFGAFLFGITIPRGSQLFKNSREWIEKFVLTFTLPLYFAQSGIKTDITTIQTGKEGAMIVLVCVCACAGKFIGAGVAAYFTGSNVRESATIATLMNCRGLVELIVLNVGLSAGIMTTETFSVMVIMAVFTTFLTSPIVEFIYPEQYRVYNDHQLVHSAETEKDEEQREIELAFRQNNKDSYLTAHKRLGVVIQSLSQIQPAINLISYLAPHRAGSELTITALRFVEPTRTDEDELIGLVGDRLTRIDEEATDLTTAYSLLADPSRKPPELLPISGYCNANRVPVNAFRIEGNPLDYPAELKTMLSNNDCSLLAIPFRGHSIFARNFFWHALTTVTTPCVLLVNLAATPVSTEGIARTRSGSILPTAYARAATSDDHKDEEEGLAKPVLFSNQPAEILPVQRRGSVTNRFEKMQLTGGVAKNSITMLLTGRQMDLLVLALLPRFLENPLNDVTVLLPADHKSFDKAIQAVLASVQDGPSCEVVTLNAPVSNAAGLQKEMEAEHGEFDLFVSAFVPPSATDQVHPLTPSAATSSFLPTVITDALFGAGSDSNSLESRLKSGMPAAYARSSLAHPELGEIGSKLYEKKSTKAQLMMIVHEPISTVRRDSLATTSSAPLVTTSHGKVPPVEQAIELEAVDTGVLDATDRV